MRTEAEWQARERELLEANNDYLERARETKERLSGRASSLAKAFLVYYTDGSVGAVVDVGEVKHLEAYGVRTEPLYAAPPIPPAEAVAAVPATFFRIAHDGFEGEMIGRYRTREGKAGVVLQQIGTRVVHVYGEKWLATAPHPSSGEER